MRSTFFQWFFAVELKLWSFVVCLFSLFALSVCVMVTSWCTYTWYRLIIHTKKFNFDMFSCFPHEMICVANAFKVSTFSFKSMFLLRVHWPYLFQVFVCVIQYIYVIFCCFLQSLFQARCAHPAWVRYGTIKNPLIIIIWQSYNLSVVDFILAYEKCIDGFCL